MRNGGWGNRSLFRKGPAQASPFPSHIPHPPFPCKGFTLVELIVVIAVVGILAGIVAVFIRNPIEGYMAASRRAELVDTADTALLRMARDARAAVPNSLRVTQAGGVYYLEFLPLADGGRYRATRTGTGNGDTLDFVDGTDGSFDVLGPAVSASTDQFLVIYNLGQDADTDAWQGGNRRAVASSGSVSQLAFTATGTPFPLESPGQRFFLAGPPVSYVCDPAAGTLTRYWGYAPAASQPTSFGGASSALLANRVKDCNLTYNPGAGQSLGQLTLWIQLENSEGGQAESVSLYREVVVNNEA
ncbi:MAG: type II secretion system protein [Pseudomonadota bacterium]